MSATAEELRQVCSILHSRGREATPGQVQAWLDKMVTKYNQLSMGTITESDVCAAVLRGQHTFTMCLHMHFGDALDE